jgi:hypothetical protein
MSSVEKVELVCPFLFACITTTWYVPGVAMTDAGSTARICVCEALTTVNGKPLIVTIGVPVPKFAPLIITTCDARFGTALSIVT